MDFNSSEGLPIFSDLAGQCLIILTSRWKSGGTSISEYL